jgi:hypothetical protein
MLGEEYLVKATMSFGDKVALEQFLEQAWDNPPSFTEEEIEQLKQACEADGLLENIAAKLLQQAFERLGNDDVCNMLHFFGHSNKETMLVNLPASRRSIVMTGYENCKPSLNEINNSAQRLLDAVANSEREW